MDMAKEREESVRRVQTDLIAALVRKEYEKTDATAIVEDLWPTLEGMFAEAVTAGMMAPEPLRKMAILMERMRQSVNSPRREG